LEDGALRKQLAQEGQKRAEYFSWQKCAQETLDLLVGTQEELSK
jgi:glycosyltransferase involved in cell wall biosynthesis